MMKRRTFVERRTCLAVAIAGALFSCASASRATTGADVAERIVVDGRVDDYADDEWVIDESSTPRDSRWGTDNNIRRLAVTWDRDRLYVALDCVTLDSNALLLVDYTAGGITGMQSLSSLRRNIVFSEFGADLLVLGSPQNQRPLVARIDGGASIELVDDGSVSARFVQFATDGGALEIAVPWGGIERPPRVVGLVCAVTGGVGTGCGDAAPDASATLGASRYDVAYLDRVLRVSVDSDGDGEFDVGVSPRDASEVAPIDSPPALDDVDFDVELDVRSFAPDLSESVSFVLRSDDPGGLARVYASARVYSVSGELVRVLYENEPRSPASVGDPRDPLDVWDGKDTRGRVVPGGLYVINVSWGVARGARTGRAGATVAVVR